MSKTTITQKVFIGMDVSEESFEICIIQLLLYGLGEFAE